MEKTKIPGFEEMGKRLTDDVGQITSAIEDRGTELRDTAYSFIKERPYASVGIAFGVGYLLSGALFSRTTMRVAAIGARFLGGALLKQLVAGGGLGFMAPAMGEFETSSHK